MDKRKVLRTCPDGNKIALHKIALRPELISKLQQEIKRLRRSTRPEVIHFVDNMLTPYPELRA